MRVRTTALLAIGVLLAGCGGSDPPPPSGSGTGSPASGGGSEIPAGGGDPETPVDTGVTCPGSHPYELALTTDAAAEVRFLDDMTACTDVGESSVWLSNGSDAVWTLAARPGATADRQSHPRWDREARLASFEAALWSTHPYPLSLPGAAVVVYDSPSSVSWTLEPSFSAGWQVHDRLADAVTQRAQAHVTDALARDTAPRRALVTCTLQAVAVAGDVGEGLEGADPAGTLLNHLGVVSGAGECGAAWAAIDRAPQRAPGSPSTWAGIGQTLADGATGLGRANTFLKAVHSAGRALLVLRWQAYLSVLHAEPAGELVQELRERFGGPLIANSGFGSVTTRDEAVRLIEAAHADAVAVGRAAIANPDLVERWAGEHPENQPRSHLFYASGAEGYTDYPTLAAVHAG